MRLGLLADIHERVAPLRRALRLFRAQGVEQVVLLGDVFDTGAGAKETVALLAGAGARGVWGNHDLGLCGIPSEPLRRELPRSVLRFAAGLQPRLVVEDCLFTHVEPWLDPEEPLQIWHAGDLPSPRENVTQSFAAAPQRVLFLGHFHAWHLDSPEGSLPWRGERPVSLAGGRFLVTVAALADGFCAAYDTRSGWLAPFAL